MSDHRDKYADRFENDQNDVNATPDTNDKNLENDQNEQKEQNAQNPWNAESVKNSWNAMTVYLPEEMRDRVDDEYNRAQYEADRGLKKDRHYKPLLFQLALERLEEMGGKEITERIERMEKGGENGPD